MAARKPKADTAPPSTPEQVAARQASCTHGGPHPHLTAGDHCPYCDKRLTEDDL